MALRKNSDQSEILRQAVKSFRDVVEVLTHPFAGGLENITRAERLFEDLNNSLPLTDFSPLDVLRSDTNIQGTNPAKDNTHQRYGNGDRERHRPAQLKVKMTQSNSRTTNETQGVGNRTSNVNPSFKSNVGNVVKIKETTLSSSHVQQTAVREITSRIPAGHNNKLLRQELGFIELNTATAVQLSSAGIAVESVNADPIQETNNDVIENTLLVVDNLAQQILKERTVTEQQKKVNRNITLHRWDRRTDNAFNKRSTVSPDASFLSQAPLPDKPKDRSPRSLEKAIDRQGQRKNAPTESSRRGIGVTYEKDVKFPMHQDFGNDLTGNGHQALSNTLYRIDMIAEELLQSTTGRRVNAKNRIDSDTVHSYKQGGDGNRLTIEEVRGNQSVNARLQKADTSSLHSCYTTHRVFGHSTAGSTPDKEAIAELINAVLVAQAGRHGVDLS